MRATGTLFKVAVIGLVLTSHAWAEAPLVPVKISYPGPGTLSYLPLDLISAIGADKEVGARVSIKYTGGGSIALQHLESHAVSFAIAGLPAVLSEAVYGGSAVSIAAVNDAPVYVLSVRSELKGKVKRIADLKGRVVGVHTSSLASKTASQQLLELLLRSEGVDPNDVRIIPSGQSWNDQSSLVIGGIADAIIGEEPIASRLRAEGRVFFLFNLADQADSKKIPGSGFLHATLVTRKDVIANAPAQVKMMVDMLKKSLQWIASHNPEEIVDRLSVDHGDRNARKALISNLKKYKNAFSKDGRFSTRQIQETELFFHQAFRATAEVQSIRAESIIDDRWVGRKD